MRLPTLSSSLLLLILIAGSTAAVAAPAGNWTCRTSTGAPAGGLSVSDMSYVYSSAPGAVAGFGRSRIDGNFVFILDGPLTGMGVKFGYFDPGPFLPAYFGAGTSESRSQLNFGMGPGKGLLCSPDRADPQP